MKKGKSTSAVVAFVLSALMAAPVLAGPGGNWRGSGGWGMGGAYQRMYNPAAVETVSGEVVSIDKMTPRKGMSYGMHVLVKSGKETIPVHLGPGWYLERQDTKINKGDILYSTCQTKKLLFKN